MRRPDPRRRQRRSSRSPVPRGTSAQAASATTATPAAATLTSRFPSRGRYRPPVVLARPMEPPLSSGPVPGLVRAGCPALLGACAAPVGCRGVGPASVIGRGRAVNRRSRHGVTNTTVRPGATRAAVILGRSTPGSQSFHRFGWWTRRCRRGGPRTTCRHRMGTSGWPAGRRWGAAVAAPEPDPDPPCGADRRWGAAGRPARRRPSAEPGTRRSNSCSSTVHGWAGRTRTSPGRSWRARCRVGPCATARACAAVRRPTAGTPPPGPSTATPTSRPRACARQGPASCRTRSCTVIRTSASSTVRALRRSWSNAPPSWGWRRSHSPTTTACTGSCGSPRRPARSGCARCSEPS